MKFKLKPFVTFSVEGDALEDVPDQDSIRLILSKEVFEQLFEPVEG